MTLLAGRTAWAGRALARDRLASYRRYAELVRLQESALARGDTDAYEALVEEGLALQDVLGGQPPVRDLAMDPEAGTGAFVAEVADLLRGALAANERIQSRLRGLRGEASSSVRRAREGRGHALEYAARVGSDTLRTLDRTL